jgi:hypothetical protein
MTIGIVGVWTCITALQRLRDGMRTLAPPSVSTATEESDRRNLAA